MWYDSDYQFVTSPILADYMDVKNRSRFLVPFATMYGLYFGQGTVSRDGMGKLESRVLEGNADVTENMTGADLATLVHE